MAEKVGSLLIDLSANVARLQSDMNQAKRTVQNAAESMSKNIEGFKTALKAGIAAEFAKKLGESLLESERSINRLNAAFEKQGQKIGFTRDQLESFADEMARATQFKDEDFRAAEAELIKFGNIYGDVFEEALKLSADLAAFNGGDLKSSAQGLAQALANPIEGLKGLGAMIGKLTPQQKDMIQNLIQSNNALGAQKFILEAVRKSVGGTAEIMNTGFSKSVTDAAKSWDKLKEALAGTAVTVLPINDAFEGLTKTLQGLSAVFEGKGFSAGFLEARTKMAKDITDLMDQIDTAKKRQGLTFTDDMGRVMGEDLHVEDMEKKLKELTDAYEKLYGAKKKAETAKPNFGLTPDQLNFIKDLNKQLATVKGGGNSTIGSLFAKADELQLGEKTRLKIQQIGQAISDNEARTKAAQEAFDGWKKRAATIEQLKDQTTELADATGLALIGGDSATREKNALLAQQNRNYENIAKQLGLLSGSEQKHEFGEAFGAQQAEWSKAWDENLKVVRSFEYGFKTTMADIAESATNVAQQTRDFFTNAFQRMEDALVSFAQTGKLNFNDFANSIIADLIRIQIRQNIVGPLAAGLGGALSFGGGASAPVFAGGLATGTNYVPQDMFTMVHKGEAVVPKEYNDGERGSAMSVVINQHNVIGDGVSYQSVRAAMSAAKDQAKAEILRSMSRNGTFAQRRR